jgi:hypothetical protein
MKTEQRLAIEGYWEGVVKVGAIGEIHTYKVRLEPGRINLGGVETECAWIDEGRGMCQFVLFSNGLVGHGIYRREKGQLVICLGQIGIPRPTRIHMGPGYNIYTLKPARKRKALPLSEFRSRSPCEPSSHRRGGRWAWRSGGALDFYEVWQVLR